MYTRLPLPMLAVLSSAAAACAVPAPEPGPETSTSAATAVVIVERSTGPGDSVRGDAVVARFVRVRQGAVDDPALRISGVAVDLPAVGACLVPSDATPAMQGRAVELLDVGQITVGAELALKPTVLLPRSMPDPAGVVSGVVYSSRSADVFAPGARVSLRAAGGPDLVEGFGVTVTAPHDLADVRVSSPSASGLDISWDATDADAHDLVYVDVLAPSPRVMIRCAAPDAGRVTVPFDSERVDEALVAVHRVHKEAFKARGIEPGEVRFDIAKVVIFRR